MESGLAHVQCLCFGTGCGSIGLRSRTGQARRRADRARVRIDRSGRPGADLAGAGTCFWPATGAALTGFGYSLVYPGFGVKAVRRVPPQSRGLAMGAYTVFLDVGLGSASRQWA